MQGSKKKRIELSLQKLNSATRKGWGGKKENESQIWLGEEKKELSDGKHSALRAN